MSSQPANQSRLAMKLRADYATPATGTGATEFAFSPSQGVSTDMAPVTDDTVRRDGWSEVDGFGSRSGGLNVLMRLSPAKQDLLWPPFVGRTAWQTISDITQVHVTSATTVTDGIVGASGSFLSLGVLRGMGVKASGLPDAANNGKWLPVLGVTASKITTPAGSLVLNASADTSFTLAFKKFLTIPTTPTPQWFDIEWWRTAQLKGKNLLQAQVISAALATGKNAKVGVTWGFVADDWEANDTGTARFTSPTKGTGNNLVTADGLYMRNGVDVKNIITDFSVNMVKASEEAGVLGPTSLFGAGAGKITGSFGVVSQDLGYFIDYYNKTNFELMFVAEDTGSNPKAGMSFYFGKCAAQAGPDAATASGLAKDQFNWSAGVDDGGGDRAASPFLITSTAP